MPDADVIPFPKLPAVEKIDDPLLDPLPGKYTEPTNAQLALLRDGVAEGQKIGASHAAVVLGELHALIEEVVRLRRIAYVAAAVAIADMDGTDANEQHELFIHFHHVVLSPDFDDDIPMCPVCRAEGE